MSSYSSKDAALYVHGSDVSDDIDAVTVKLAAITQQFTGLGNVFPTTYDTGLRTGEITCSGLYNSITGASPVLAAVAGTNRVVTLTHEGGTRGSRAWCFQAAVVSGAEVGLSREEMHSLTPDLTVAGEVNNAYVVAPLAARAADGTTDADDADGAASSTGAHAFLHVTEALTGSPTSVAIKVRSSSDAITYADCTGGAFTAVTGATSQCITMTGTIERYLSIQWTWTGGTNPTWTGIVSVARD